MIELLYWRPVILQNHFKFIHLRISPPLSWKKKSFIIIITSIISTGIYSYFVTISKKITIATVVYNRHNYHFNGQIISSRPWNAPIFYSVAFSVINHSLIGHVYCNIHISSLHLKESRTSTENNNNNKNKTF